MGELHSLSLRTVAQESRDLIGPAGFQAKAIQTTGSLGICAAVPGACKEMTD